MATTKSDGEKKDFKSSLKTFKKTVEKASGTKAPAKKPAAKKTTKATPAPKAGGALAIRKETPAASYKKPGGEVGSPKTSGGPVGSPKTSGGAVGAPAKKGGEVAAPSKPSGSEPPKKKFDTSNAEDAKYTAKKAGGDGRLAKLGRIAGATKYGRLVKGALSLVGAAAAVSELKRAVDGESEPKQEAPKAPMAQTKSEGGLATGKANADTKAKSSEPKQAAQPAAKKAPGKTESKSTSYPVYPKNSSKAADFRAAFAAARKSGKATFVWEGRKYNTKLKGE